MFKVTITLVFLLMLPMFAEEDKLAEIQEVSKDYLGKYYVTKQVDPNGELLKQYKKPKYFATVLKNSVVLADGKTMKMGSISKSTIMNDNSIAFSFLDSEVTWSVARTKNMYGICCFVGEKVSIMYIAQKK